MAYAAQYQRWFYVWKNEFLSLTPALQFLKCINGILEKISGSLTKFKKRHLLTPRKNNNQKWLYIISMKLFATCFGKHYVRMVYTISFYMRILPFLFSRRKKRIIFHPNKVSHYPISVVVAFTSALFVFIQFRFWFFLFLYFSPFFYHIFSLSVQSTNPKKKEKPATAITLLKANISFQLW